MDQKEDFERLTERKVKLEPGGFYRITEKGLTRLGPGDFDSVQDSGRREEFGTGSVRDSREGKGRYDLLPPHAIFRLARHFENGAKKYGERNWEDGQPISRYLDSALRHLFKLLSRELDEDHAAAAAWNIMAFMETGWRISKGSLPAELDDLGWFEHPDDLAPLRTADDPGWAADPEAPQVRLVQEKGERIAKAMNDDLFHEPDGGC